MGHKYSFIVLGGNGTTIKQFQFSRIKIIGITLLMLIAIGGLGYAGMDYVKLYDKIHDKEIIERQLALQTEEVIHQREQIQKFAKEINIFKEKLVQLDQFKESICIIANIDKAKNEKGLFGIGGSAPEDLNPSIDLTKRHQRLMKDMHQQVGQLNHASTLQHDEFRSLLEKLESQKNLLAHTPAIRPVKGWITSKFGYRRSPFTNKREFHKGLDIANRKGTPIVATANGVVSFAELRGQMGKMVVIDHGHGIITRYAHLDKIVRQPGESVLRGAVIGHMGNTGRSTGPHLHYEVRLNGVPMNPTKYILN